MTIHSVRAFALPVALALAAGLADPAAAAPQVLGVMASHGPVPLTCAGTECRAEVTAFCLQESRPVPSEGTAYQPVGVAPMTLVLHLADGGRLRLDAGEHARFSSRRGFTAVSIAISHDLLVRHGAVSAAIEIGPEMTIAPVPVAGDPKPQGEEELALAAGPVRAFATERLERDAAAHAARLTQQLINALPRQDEETAAIRTGLWDAAIGATPAADPAGIAMARRSYEGCHAALNTGYMKNMRYCLELQHGEMMIERNHAFWREAGAGS
ncbi:MAG TPA: hypothetical protein VED46_16230 [Alphaproteobacteria bacterium]|nr:hypothetical protein [Alphaproteobacteria bacterium]